MTLDANHLTPAEHHALRARSRGESPAAAARRLGIPESRYRILIHRLQRRIGARVPHDLNLLLVRGGRR